MTVLKRKLVGLASLALLGGIGLSLLFWHTRWNERRASEETAEKKILTIDGQEDVASFRLTTPAGQYLLQRPKSDGASWRITEPREVEADRNTIEGILNHLGKLQQAREVGEPRADGTVIPPEDLSLFGLEHPRFEVAIESSAGAEERLLVGKKTRFDGSIYVKRSNSSAVSMVSGALEYQLDKDLFKLREKRLVRFDNAAVKRFSVEIDGGKAPYAVERRGGEFYLAEPNEVRADSSQITGILSALTELRARRFVSEALTEPELKAHGFDPPRARVSIALAESDSPLLILFGRVGENDEATHFATQGVGSPLIELGSDWAIRKLLSDPNELRDKHLLAFDRDDVRSVSISKGDVRLSFEMERDKENDRNDWKMTAPEVADAQDSMLTGIIYRLWSMKARRIVTDKAETADIVRHGLEEPELRVELFGEGAVSIGSLLFSEADGSERHAMAAGSRRIDRIDGNAIDEISLDPSDYKDEESEPR